MKVPIDGGATVTLATGQEEPRYVAVDAASVYWMSGGKVSKVPK